ncbi:MAG TPA: hypothetical protein VLV17_08085 [Anaeromyxobacteraceae bacterium]|nr:hypothetical protein [Anaeromyxobacteraceae bacterium]
MEGPQRPDPGRAPAERGPAAPAAQAAAAALLSLARAARSFVLYDPGNAVVRQLLAEYQERMRAALERHGPLIVLVRPFEMLVGGEVVYKDADREKSLAFKLFRDGVRRLEFLPTVGFAELLKFLEILAIRYTGVRQQEDDTVTLLRRAEFHGIALDAVEGFTPAEESPEGDAGAERGHTFQPVGGWDTPLPRLPQPVPAVYREVDEAQLASLRGGEPGSDGVEIGLSVARDLLAEASRASWPSPNPDLAAFLAELRDGLLADGRLDGLRRLVDLLGEAGGGELREDMLRSLGDARTLELVLESVPEEATRLPGDLIPFLPLLGIEAVLDALARLETTEARRRMLLQIGLARLPREADAVLARLPALETRLARELGRGLVARAPERANDVARQFLGQKDEALRLEGLAALEAAPGAVPLRPLYDLLADPSETVRVRVVNVLARHGDESTVLPLRSLLEEGREVSPREADAIGRALAAVAPIAAGRLFALWLEPKARFMRGLSAQQRAQQWAAVAGTGELPGADPEPVLTALAEKSEGELRRHCLATLARRRKEKRGPTDG